MGVLSFLFTSLKLFLNNFRQDVIDMHEFRTVYVYLYILAWKQKFLKINNYNNMQSVDLSELFDANQSLV